MIEIVSRLLTENDVLLHVISIVYHLVVLSLLSRKPEHSVINIRNFCCLAINFKSKIYKTK